MLDGHAVHHMLVFKNNGKVIVDPAGYGGLAHRTRLLNGSAELLQDGSHAFALGR